MSKSDIYGPDLSEHEADAKAIAETGLRCMKSNQSTSEEAKSSGPDTSRNNLEKLSKGD